MGAGGPSLRRGGLGEGGGLRCSARRNDRGAGARRGSGTRMSPTPPIWELHAAFFTRALPRIRWMLRPMTHTFFYRRSIELRAGVADYIVYAVQPAEGARPDPVPVIAAYPAGWVPTDLPGQCLFDRDAPARTYETCVPLSQFRHYERITQEDAIALHPALFRAALTPNEVAAIKSWLNLGSWFVREYKASGELPFGWSAVAFEQFLCDLDSALAKAPSYSGIAYRGMAASPLIDTYVRELRELVASREDYVAPRHLSASLSDEIGHGHCYLDQDDDPKAISVLLVCRVFKGRLLPGFVHKARDEQEVVLTAGSRFRRLGARRLESPREGHELWKIDFEQVA